jgi:hypothetical protein
MDEDGKIWRNERYEILDDELIGGLSSDRLWNENSEGIRKLFICNQDLIDSAYPTLVKIQQKFRNSFVHKHFAFKNSTLSYAFHSFIYENGDLYERKIIERLLVEGEKSSLMKAVPLLFKRQFDFLYNRLTFFDSHPALSFWYLFWDDVWRNNKDMQIFQGKDELFSPMSPNSLCYRLLPRRELVALLEKNGLCRHNGRRGWLGLRRGYLNTSLLDSLYHMMGTLTLHYAPKEKISDQEQEEIVKEYTAAVNALDLRVLALEEKNVHEASNATVPNANSPVQARERHTSLSAAARPSSSSDASAGVGGGGVRPSSPLPCLSPPYDDDIFANYIQIVDWKDRLQSAPIGMRAMYLRFEENIDELSMPFNSSAAPPPATNQPAALFANTSSPLAPQHSLRFNVMSNGGAANGLLGSQHMALPLRMSSALQTPPLPLPRADAIPRAPISAFRVQKRKGMAAARRAQSVLLRQHSVGSPEADLRIPLPNRFGASPPVPVAVASGAMPARAAHEYFQRHQSMPLQVQHATSTSGGSAGSSASALAMGSSPASQDQLHHSADASVNSNSSNSGSQHFPSSAGAQLSSPHQSQHLQQVALGTSMPPHSMDNVQHLSQQQLHQQQLQQQQQQAAAYFNYQASVNHRGSMPTTNQQHTAMHPDVHPQHMANAIHSFGTNPPIAELKAPLLSNYAAAAAAPAAVAITPQSAPASSPPPRGAVSITHPTGATASASAAYTGSSHTAVRGGTLSNSAYQPLTPHAYQHQHQLQQQQRAGGFFQYNYGGRRVSAKQEFPSLPGTD